MNSLNPWQKINFIALKIKLEKSKQIDLLLKTIFYY